MSVMVLGLKMPKSCFSCYVTRRTRLKNCPINILCETNKHDEADKFLDEDLIHMDCPLRPVVLLHKENA